MAQIKLGNLLWRPHTRPISPEDPVDVKDINTADIKAKLEMVQSELALVKAELQEIKANQLSGDQKVQLTGRTAEIETIINAQSIAPSSNTGFIQIDFKGCRKALLAVNCDQPWRMMSNSLWGSIASESAGAHLYPNTVSSVDQSPVTSPNYPRVIVVGAHIGGPDSTVTSYETALARAELPANFRVNIDNRSTENTATITLRVMRIW